MTESTNTHTNTNTNRARIALIAAAIAAAAAALVVGVTVSVDAGDGPQQAAITATDDALELEGFDDLDAGLADIEIAKTSEAAHGLIVARLHDGVTDEDFAAALGSPDAMGAFALADFYGGINSVPADGEWTVTVDLDPGHYVVLDHGTGPNGPDGPAWFTDPDFFRPFDVSGTHVDADRPSATAAVDLNEFAFTGFPGHLPGKGVLRFTNSGAQRHEVDLVRLNEGVTVEHALHLLAEGASDAPGVEVGLLGVISPGHDVSVGYELESGTYLVVCLFPDEGGEHMPHAALGMVADFTVD